MTEGISEILLLSGAGRWLLLWILGLRLSLARLALLELLRALWAGLETTLALSWHLLRVRYAVLRLQMAALRHRTRRGLVLLLQLLGVLGLLLILGLRRHRLLRALCDLWAGLWLELLWLLWLRWSVLRRWPLPWLGLLLGLGWRTLWWLLLW